MGAFGEFGIRHEIAKRWTPFDLFKSNQVRKKIDQTAADLEISKIIELGKPALIGRLGGTEARFLGEYLKISKIKNLQRVMSTTKPNWIKRSKEINTNAGFFFENLEQVNIFFSLYDEALSETDILGAWGTAFAWIESNYIEKINSVIPVPMTAPWITCYENSSCATPWSTSLNGKRVLVISPFAESIEIQHKRIREVFPKIDYPDFKLTTIRAFQTTGYQSQRVPNWFELLNHMKIQMTKSNFDVALISAGAYSYPLAHFAKKLGKIGIHTGGGLQLFFGVLGRRWDNLEDIKNIKNSSWVRPSKSETPPNALSIEKGCYW
jgi:hypothetical protein